jgi:hypothetical protein
MFNIDFRNNYSWNGAFAVIDIVGTIPIIVDLRSKHGHIESAYRSWYYYDCFPFVEKNY